jgi:hypothetical protein
LAFCTLGEIRFGCNIHPSAISTCQRYVEEILPEEAAYI